MPFAFSERCVASTAVSDRSEHQSTVAPPATAAAAGTMPLPQLRCTEVLRSSLATASASMNDAGSSEPCAYTPGLDATKTRVPAMASGAFCQVE